MNYKKMRITESLAVNQVWAYIIITLVIGLIVSGIIYVAKLDIFSSPAGILLYLIYMLCPALVATAILAIMEGKAGVMDLLRGLLRWKVSGYWYLLAIFFPIAVEILTFEAFIAISGKVPAGYSLSLLPWDVMLDIFLASIGMVLGLGYLLPQLLKTYSTLAASAVTAVFLIVYRATALINDPNLLVMCVGLFALAFILVWMYDNARNSLLLLTIFMFIFTLTSNMFSYRLSAYSGEALPIYMSKAMFIVIIVLVVILHRHFSED